MPPNSAAVAWAASRFTSAIATRAPSDASTVAIPRPIPRAEPVTIAPWPSSRCIYRRKYNSTACRSGKTILPAHFHAIANRGHARARVGHAVDDDQAVEAHAHAAEHAARLAARGRACRGEPLREQYRRDGLALVGG